MHTCPVCGYDKMREPPRDYYICACCGTEFDNDDAYQTHAELRDAWLLKGAPWFSTYTQPTDTDSERLARIRIGQGV